VAELTGAEARRLRLRAQGLHPGLPIGPAEAVGRGVALQGQDLPAVLRAIAIRSAPGTTVDEVRAAFDRGELLRGWTQRGTLFATTPAHYAALSSLTAHRSSTSLETRRAQLGLDAATIDAAEAVVRALLATGGATRGELMAAWRQAGIDTAGQRGYHLIARFALGGLMHWGPFAGVEQRLVATPPRAPSDPEETLAGLVRGYLASHAPATAADAAWWLGLPKTPVRAALASLGDELLRVDVDGVPHLALLETMDGPAPEESGVILVPGFDEVYLGYQDRSLIASAATQSAIVPGGNGVFKPAVLVDGYVVGTWRRSPRKGEEPCELTERTAAATRRRIAAALAAWPHG